MSQGAGQNGGFALSMVTVRSWLLLFGAIAGFVAFLARGALGAVKLRKLR